MPATPARRASPRSLGPPPAPGRRLIGALSRAGWLTALIAVTACGRGERTVAEPAPPLHLAMAGGGAFDLAAQRDTTVVLFFGYTHCPDVCPTTLADFAAVRRRLGSRAARVKFVFVTVDPARDDPARAMAWARGFDSTFVGLSGDSATLAAIQRGFHVAAMITRDSTQGLVVSHSTTVFVIGPHGLLRERVSLTPRREDDLYDAIRRAAD
jgi:protein SCO1/2